MTKEEKMRQETEEKIERGITNRNRQIKNRILIVAFAGAISLATVSGIKVAKAYDAAHVTIKEIEDDILTHSGHNYDPEGTRIDPYLGHDCPVKEYDGRLYEERLAETMEEQGFHEETIEAAETKYALLYTDQVEEANEIDLEQIEKAAKEKHKTR